MNEIKISKEGAEFLKNVLNQITVRPTDPDAAKTISLVQELMKALETKVSSK